MIPGGFGGGTVLWVALGIIVLIWLASGLFRVQPDQEGIVLRFGQYTRTAQPGLHYHLPAPFETVITPSVTSVNRIDVGFVSASEQGRGGPIRDVPDESLMLTGDENIIDIDFTILWQIADARSYLFNVRDPEVTVKAIGESAMREVIGQTEIQPALTEARQSIESQTRETMQRILDDYGAGIAVLEVQLQKVDPPQQVVDAFNDVLRARQDQQRLRNEAEAYRNNIIPQARGEAERINQESLAYKEQTVARADGDAQRFTSVLQAYRLAPEITAQRFYLETLETVFAGTSKVIIDEGAGGTGQGVVPYLPLDQLIRNPAGTGGN